jgi:hypothetical protein
MDADIVKRVFAQVAIYCTKLKPDFGTHLNCKLHHMVCNKNAGGAWNTPLVGNPLYAIDVDYHSDNTTT